MPEPYRKLLAVHRAESTCNVHPQPACQHTARTAADLQSFADAKPVLWCFSGSLSAVACQAKLLQKAT